MFRSVALKNIPTANTFSLDLNGEAINKCEAGDYPNTEISFLISNAPEIEKYAQRYNIPFYYVKTFKDPAKREPVQLEIIQRYVPDVIGLDWRGEKKVFANALGKTLQHKTIAYDNKTIVFN